MQVRTYAAYWHDRGVTSPTPLLGETIEGFGEIIVDIGDDKILDGGGGRDIIITPQGASADLNSVVYREYTLRNDQGQTYLVDVIHLNAATNLGTAGQTNTGAMIMLNFEQWMSTPNDPSLRVVSFRDYANPYVPAEHFTEKFTYEVSGQGWRYYNDMTFGTLEVSGKRSDYVLSRDSDDMLVLKHSSGAINLAAGFERIAFDDGVLAFDDGANAGQVYRLYQAAFDRVPDVAGLKYWIDAFDQGKFDLTGIAGNFINSKEFIDTYGTPSTVSNKQFIELLYQHTLGRAYDQAGLDYWVGVLEAGQVSRTHLLAQFSESDENKGRVSDAIDDGIWFA